MNRTVTAVLFSACFAIAHPVLADELYIGVAQQGNAAIEVPYNGLTKEQVIQRFGEPTEKKAAVGKPPISTWIYPDFTVYFEYNIVLHAVKSIQAAQPSE